MNNRKYSDTEIRRMADVFKSLGNPVRLKILTHLMEGESCVCDLVEISGAGFSTVSRHLSVMKAAGLLIDDKRGQQVFYKLAMPCVVGFIDCLLDVSNCNSQSAYCYTH
jgi:DNA-binding transcriptional ArsR family regulator